MNTEVITIDGPSGTGKGTVSRRLQTWLGWHLLDSGALYRVVGLIAVEQRVSLADETALASVARTLDVVFEQADDETRVIVCGRDVSAEIRTEDMGAVASRVAAFAIVREALLQRQRDFQQPPGLVADGRDMGTVVFPHAALKIFLTASADERARRRHKQLIEKGISVSLAQLSGDIAERDRRDAERAVSPLKPADDAVLLDTSTLNALDVEKVVRNLVCERGLARTAS